MGDLLFFGLPLFAFPLGYLAGRARSSGGRLAGLFATLLLPFAAYTGLMASLEPAAPGFFTWWRAGLEILAVPIAIWCGLALLGFAGGRKSGRAGSGFL